LLELLSSKNLNDKLNRLYDSKSPMNFRKKTVTGNHNINNSVIINNYHPLNQDNEETDKLI